MNASTIKTLSGDYRIAEISAQITPAWRFDPICKKIVEQMEYRDKQFVYLADFDEKISKIKLASEIDEQELKDLCTAASMSHSARQFFLDDINHMHARIEMHDREIRKLLKNKRDVYNYPIATAESEILKLWKSIRPDLANSFKKYVLREWNDQIKANVTFQSYKYYGFIKSLELL